MGCISAERRAIAATILAIADAARSVAALIAQGALGGRLGDVVSANAQGEEQKDLDVRANEIVISALREAPVPFVVSEELEFSLVIKEGTPMPARSTMRSTGPVSARRSGCWRARNIR